MAGPWGYVAGLAARRTRECDRLGERLFKADTLQRYETLVDFDTVKTGLALPLPAPRPTRPHDGRP
ncbi:MULTISPECIES: hypothetical protein [unclassified Actinomadura]|uniref:hypothetical protein n=1 Tax=unclassified Actinomadura TaxID=2626254 RepID=UPI0011EFE009|nr:hypothetical protein [Actinomadura sp. K4S16]